jgi:4,5-DOPA dioxygenase extradiol
VTLPSLFVSHGSPTVLIDGDPARAAWGALTASLPHPRAVVVMSPHWLTAAPRVASVPRHRTLHDFAGFPPALYAFDYPAPGDPALAAAVAARLGAAGLPAELAGREDIDHGAWVPLLSMYPAADVPVVQVAVQPRLGPAHHYALGAALAGLRDEGVLVLGSGALTHNLREVQMQSRTAPVPDWVRAFADWVDAQLVRGEAATLLDYRRLAPHAERNHPTEEHLLPLFFALGAAGEGARATREHAGFAYGAVAMHAYRFRSEADRAAA